MKRYNDKAKKHNKDRLERALQEVSLKFLKEFGRNPNEYKIADRVWLSRHKLNFDCDPMKIYE